MINNDVTRQFMTNMNIYNPQIIIFNLIKIYPQIISHIIDSTKMTAEGDEVAITGTLQSVFEKVHRNIIVHRPKQTKNVYSNYWT